MGMVGGQKVDKTHIHREIFTARQYSSGLPKLPVVFMVAPGALALLVCHSPVFLWFLTFLLLSPVAWMGEYLFLPQIREAEAWRWKWEARSEGKKTSRSLTCPALSHFAHITDNLPTGHISFPPWHCIQTPCQLPLPALGIFFSLHLLPICLC